MNGERRRFRSVPIYPALFFVAWIVTIYVNATASLQSLGRPLVIGLVIVAVLQVVLSGIARDRYIGGILVTVVFISLVSLPVTALLACAVLIVAAGMGIARQSRVARIPWPALTRLLNIVAAVNVSIVLVNGGLAGALTPVAGRGTERGVADPSLPDIYLVLLDAYPRSDTLATDFSFDNGPFLDQMGAMGFDVSTGSHSNYNMTWLTLASMFNMAQVADLPGVSDSASVIVELRALASAMNRGKALGAVESAGYEVVSIPSDFSSAVLYNADRVLGGDQMTDFEDHILEYGAFPSLFTDAQRQFLLGQHRDRVLSTFDRLGQVAAERTDHPRFVFAHVLSPHAPIAFGPNGESRDDWPCFPTICNIWYGGQIYGDQLLGPFRDQVQFINKMVAKTAEQILANSARPPIIVFFSDHGSRFDFSDPDEMLRSFLIANTPGHPRLFPDDATPLNLIPRILNAYAGTELPLASEESFWIDYRTFDFQGPKIPLIPRVVQAP